MFKLEDALTQWRDALIREGCAQRSILEELEDHLLCEIERLVGDGVSEETAFLIAVESVGCSNKLAQEFRKNRAQIKNAASAVIRTLCKLEKQDMKSNRSPLPIIGHSLVWAAMMIACSLVLRGTEHAADIQFLLLSGWFATFMMIQPNGAVSVKAEWACIKRYVSNMAKS